ncbi:MAG: hypothetical protein K0R17_887, partial [Rariglobus sp.]|nr:hypothetical protein [Rariglobus sp.]
MISIEKALLINLSSGLSLGSAWRGLKTEPIPAEKIPNTLVLNGHHVAELRQLWERRAEPVIAALEALSAQADRLLDQGPWSVVDKTNLPNGQDPHDYRSLAKYWWPDPAKPDGIPYFRRDGDVNPACYSSDYDLLRLESLSDSTVALALSAFITGNVAHRARAIELLRVWFIDPLTRQNPSFAQAQHIPGDTSIRSAGLIESRRLIYIVEAIRLLSATGELPETITQ